MKNILKKSKIIKNLYLKVIDITKIYFPKFGAQMRYFIAYGKKSNLDNPETFSEKLLWLSLNTYNNNPNILKYSDKYLVREYVESLNYEDNLNELLLVWDTPTDIQYDLLPYRFVIKRSQGCSTNLICKNKNQLDIETINHTIYKWEQENYWYDKIMAKVGGDKSKKLSNFYICEKFLDQDNSKELVDYKIYCFNGKPICLLVIMDRYSNKSGVFMSPDWNIISNLSGSYSNPHQIPEKPKSLKKMLEIAKDLSKPFPFVRVDMYDIGGKAIFGEMTFFPNGCVNMQETEISGLSMGKLLDISTELRILQNKEVFNE